MFEMHPVTRRWLEKAWPFVAGLLVQLRERLGDGSDLVPYAVYYGARRKLRILESLVRRMIYLRAMEIEVTWSPPKPSAGQAARRPHAAPVQTSATPKGPGQLAVADTWPLYIPGQRSSIDYSARPSIWVFGTPRAPEPEAPQMPEEMEAGGLIRRLARLEASCEDPEKAARRMALWQARRLQVIRQKPCRTHPLRVGRPPGYCRRLRRKDPLQGKLYDAWCFCHWADLDAYKPPPRPASG
ncbi:hypothetical protein [Hyphomonas pacifica]|uniref:Uncharacterized protein n=1 Tax=Hyphomonas pacifica TaxID=1280941 RepID=A0A062U4Z1_9PROT|nr:hypothetical protein [Hyphomonas pacifica]KCZ52833.1 hypothetical protein HY2_06800 [Hyphomonas pacifica]RAN35297.1 hypothetical protein HY3_08330 [Hyphomonas pacifica]RAN38311.1 hypothetical protein HY11_00440 [Hyphomonas pacifica]